MFAISIHFQPGLIFVSKAGAYQSGAPSNGRLLAMPTNLRLGWERLGVTNALAYYSSATITAVKSLIVHAQGGKLFETISIRGRRTSLT